MKSPNPAFIILFAAYAMCPARAEAGAWSQQKGHYYAKLTEISYSADKTFNADGVKMGRDPGNFMTRPPVLPPFDTSESIQIFLYAEYGLLDRMTVVSQLSAGRLTTDTVIDEIVVHSTATGVGDLNLGIKYQLVDKPVVLSPYVRLKVPTGYDRDGDPPMGTGRVDLELRLLAAKAFYPWPLYVGAESGFRFRGGRFSNQLPYFFEVGATPHSRIFLKAFLQGIDTLADGGRAINAMEAVSMQISEGDFTKIGGNAAINVFGGASVDLLYEVIVRGRNVGAGRSFGLGLSYTTRHP